MPCHGAIKMMKIEILDAFDPIILPPALRRPTGSAGKQPMQHAQEYGSLKRESVLAPPYEFVEHRSPTCLPPTIALRQEPDLCAST